MATARRKRDKKRTRNNNARQEQRKEQRKMSGVRIKYQIIVITQDLKIS